MGYKVLAAGMGVGLAGALAGLAAYAARQISGPTPPAQRDLSFTFTPFETGVDYEPVSFAAADGVALSGWFFARPDSQQVVIGCHGHRGGKHELLGIGSGLWRAGMNVLLFDFRGRGGSDDSVCSLAYHEIADLTAAVKFVQSRLPAARIGVVGYSMGAAVSILAAAAEPAISAVVADSSFAVMRDIVRHAIRRRRLPAQPFVDLADRITGHRYGYRFESVRPIDVIGQLAPRPLLIIHGSADQVIPVDHAYQLFEAAGQPKELWIDPDIEHCGSYFLDRGAYVNRVARFFQRHLGPM